MALDKTFLVLMAAGLLAACTAATQPPPPTAFQRNVGFGSSAVGTPYTTNGSVGRPGDPIVPGVASASSINR
jgi:hypothetical protein